MSDNTTINQGSSGDVIATDQLADGSKVQRVKAQFGDDGSAQDVSNAYPLPIKGATIEELLSLILIELRVHSIYLKAGLLPNSIDEPSQVRLDAARE